MISHLYSHEFIFDTTVNCEKKEGSYCAYTDVLWFTSGQKKRYNLEHPVPKRL